MAWSPITSGTNNSVVAVATLTATSGAVSVGDTINVAVTFGQTGALVPATSVITDNLGNTYQNTQRVNDNVDDQVLELWVSIVTHAGTPTVQVQFNPTPGTTQAQNCSLNVDPFTGSDATSTTDGSAGQLQTGPGTGTDAVSSGTYTTTVNGDLIYCASVENSTGSDPGAHGTGFTDATISGGVVLHTEWLSQTSASATTKGTFTTTSGTATFATASHAITPKTVVVVFPENITVLSQRTKKRTKTAIRFIKPTKTIVVVVVVRPKPIKVLLQVRKKKTQGKIKFTKVFGRPTTRPPIRAIKVIYFATQAKVRKKKFAPVKVILGKVPRTFGTSNPGSIVIFYDGLNVAGGLNYHKGLSRPHIILVPAGGGNFFVTKDVQQTEEKSDSILKETYLIDGDIP